MWLGRGFIVSEMHFKEKLHSYFSIMRLKKTAFSNVPSNVNFSKKNQYKIMVTLFVNIVPSKNDVNTAAMLTKCQQLVIHSKKYDGHNIIKLASLLSFVHTVGLENLTSS